MVLLVVIIHAAFPQLMANAAGGLRTQPWSSLGRGIAIALIATAIAGALMMSIFGIPLGSTVFMAIGIAWVVGFATVCACIGLYVRAWRRSLPADVEPRSQMWWAALGAVLLGVIALVPILGWLVAGLAVAAGLGAASSEIWQRLRQA